MVGSLEGIQVKITLTLEGSFESAPPYQFTSVVVGQGAELVVPISARILSDTDGNGTIEPVQGPNGLLDGTVTIDISGNQVFAQFQGTAQPAGFRITIEGLAPAGVAPGTITEQGSMSGVNMVYAPTYDAATKTLGMYWYFLGFQPGTTVNQSVFYDNQLADAPQAADDAFGVKVGVPLTGKNVLSNDVDLDNGGPLGVVDLQRVTHVNGVAASVGQWVDLPGGGRILLKADGSLQFSDDGDFSDLAIGQTRATSFQYTVTDSAGLSDTATTTITVEGVNRPSTATNLTQTKTFVEDAGPVALDDIVVSDLDPGETVTVTLTLSNPLAGALSTGSFGGVTSTYNTATGIWTATGSVADVNALLAAVTFSPALNWNQNVTIATRVRDASGQGPADGVITLQGTAVNDAPTASATGSAPVHTENGSAVDLFSNVSIGTVEAGQTITGMTLTVSNLADGAHEVLIIDGTSILLTDGFTATTGANGVTVSVNLSGATATVTLSKTGGLSAAGAQTLVDGIAYRNTSESPTVAGDRVVTLTGITDNGGTANGGVDTTSLSLSATISLAAVNDAPTLSGGPYVLPAANEDAASGGTLVSSILSGLTHGDADAAAPSGIAITATAGSGTWQYSTDGVTWNVVGTVSGSAALLLSGSTQLRFVPNGENGETATLTFRAWDQTSGTPSTNSARSTADTTSNGGTTAFSTGTAQASLTVSSVNDAPVLSPISPVLTGLADADVNNAGQTVASIVGASIADVDSAAAEGIAITGLTSGSGTWQYSLDGGSTWHDMGSVSASSALLLRATDNVRFVPDGVSGTTGSLTYKAWDQSGSTAGLQGTKVDASAGGGSTPFSSVTDTASITVTAVNDVPVVTASGGSTAFVEGADVASTPVAVDPGLTLSDSDNATLASAKVTIVGNFYPGQDVLAFINDGISMGNITASYDADTGVLTLISAGATATLAQWQAALRSVTYTNSSDSPVTAARVMSFTVNDGSLDSSGASKSVSIEAVNDTPAVTVPSAITVTEDVATALTGISFSDTDSGSNMVTVTLAVASGILSALSGGGVTAAGNGTGSLTLTGTIANINSFINGGHVSFTTASNATADVVLTATINDNGNVGNGGAKSATATTTIEVAQVNDAPTITAPVSIAVSEDTFTALTGFSFADMDAGGNLVVVTLEVSHGTLTALNGANVTVGGSGTGSLTLTGSIADINTFIADSLVSFKTDPDATSNVVLTVGIDDGGNTGTGGAKTAVTTTTLVVTAVNDAPVNSVPSAQIVDQDGILVFSSGNGNLIAISDVDAGNGTLRVTLTATHGSIALSGTSGLSFLVGSGSGDATMTFDGTLAAINQALNGLSITPEAGYHGPASLQVVTSDLGLSGSRGTLTDSDTISIHVRSVEPRVASVNVTNADGTYKPGDTIVVTVTFDQAVIVDAAGGVPSLLLETGSQDRTARYVSGSGTNVLAFAYKVQAGDVSADLDYHSINALSLNGATIRNAANDDAILTLPAPGGAGSIGGQHDIVIEYGAEVTPRPGGGVGISITDPDQLTSGLGTSGLDEVVYSGSGRLILPGKIENLTLTGGDAQADGNNLANAIRGSAGDNVLRGLGGNDWMHSGDGDDSVDGGLGRDYLFGGRGDDVVKGNSGNDTIYGYMGDDSVYGGSGNDLMSGSAGSDRVYGGVGDDTVNGGSGNDWVYGEAGDDRVYGSIGNDTIRGGTGNDTLNGGAGNDMLYGNAGRDAFVFDTRPSRSGNIDTIVDFNPGYDRILLDNAVFAALGKGSAKGVKLSAEMFVAGTSARDGDDRIVYDRKTGALYYDPDGSGSAVQVKIATLANKPELTHHVLFVI
ncbi:Ca2+-binding RTX toxin-like protein [Microvirga flocculans]|uniref:Ca2+-binding RTX toxin-like protein n=1 Tax=Microvirga flocculans TaxID=217168 RepID=A0A7W6N8Z5_9HYPH|nr:Ig-like domain-containing protein [Microvirga flocculans]MBB4041176.1 Ca2+-binding RTX toxin-like protein [Microvirga flocculans]